MKFKKTILSVLATVSLTAMVGCSDTDDLYLDVAKDNSISFSTYINRNSRGASLTSENISDFGVFAYHDLGKDYASGNKIPNYMYNQMVVRNGNSWTYTPVKYWPADVNERISFFAYAPYCAAAIVADEATTSVSEMIANDTSGDPMLRFSVGTDVENHKDLVYAKAVDRNNTGGIINLEFKHALSRVGFNVIGWDANNGEYDDNTTVTINAIKLATNRKEATLNLNTGEWSNPSESESLRSFTLSTRNGLLQNNVIVSGATDAKQLNKDNEYIMMLPDMSGNDQYILFVDYTVETQDPTLSSGSHIVRNNIYSRFTPHFVAGKAYTINVHLGMSGGESLGEDVDNIPTDPDPDPKNPVTPTAAGNTGPAWFSTTIEDWGEPQETNVPNVHAGLQFNMNDFAIDVDIDAQSRAVSTFTALSLVPTNTAINGNENILKQQSVFNGSSFVIPANSIDFVKALQGVDYTLTLASSDGDIYKGTVNMDYVSMEMTINSALGNSDGFYVPFKYGYTPAALMLLWGDDTQSEVITSISNYNRLHKYKEDGIYTIRILSAQSDYNELQIPKFNFSSGSGGNSSYEKNQKALISVDTPILNMGSYLGFIFGYCINLTSLHEDVFAHCADGVNLEFGFQNCTSLESLPTNLLKHLPNLENLNCTFQACKKIKEIPADFLKYNAKLKNLSGCFSDLPELTIIPSRLFDANPDIEDFSYVFGGCEYLEIVPAGLFANNLKATNFRSAFSRDYRLYDFENVFINNPEEKSTRFAQVEGELNLNEIFHMVGNYVANISKYKAVNFHEYEIPNGYTGKPYASANRNFANYRDIQDLY